MKTILTQRIPIFRTKLLLMLIVALASFSNAIAQSVTGKVIDEKGEGLPGVNILVKGTTSGAISDAKGAFSVNAPKNATLVLTYVGFVSKEVQINGKTSLTISLTQDNRNLEEVVVVGYGTQKKATVTGAVVAVQGEKILRSPNVEISNSLAGRLPGLVVIQSSGEPGNDGARISIRGTNTLGNSSPLVVIDGVPDRDGGVGRLNGNDIESISVLKDASAAIYGARAANGAILVTTKQGKAGKPTITYNFNTGWSQPARVPQMANSSEYAQIMNELPIYKTIPDGEWGAAWKGIQSTGTFTSPSAGTTINANYSPEAVKGYAAGTDKWKYPNTDWFGDAFKTWSPQSSHNLSISGGSETIRYFSSIGYVNQDAYYKNSATSYQQFNFRTNVEANISKYIVANLGIMTRREQRRFPTESAGSIFRMLMRGRPTEPEVWPNGLPGPDIENGQNPYVITTNATGYIDNPVDYLQTNGSVSITNPWIEGLKVTLSAAVDKNSGTNKIWQTPWKLYSWDKVSYEADGVTPKLVGAIRSNFTDPRLSQGYSSLLNTNLTAQISYDKQINKLHNVGVMMGVTKENFSGEGFFAYRRNYISPAIDQLFAGGSLQQNTGGSAYSRARLGYYGRLQYNYNEKYLAEFIARYDGSYIFPESSRFGFFPGVLLGWNVSKEDFFKVPAIDHMKVRASYGQMGNDQVFFNGQLQEYAYLSTYGFGNYPINSQVVTTLGETVLANPNFTWERANNYNLGIDMSLLNNKIDVILEYFYNKRDQILIQKNGSTPASSGINSLLPPVNAGIVENKGFEFNIGYNGKATKDLTFRAGVNGGYAKNKVIYMDEIPGAPSYQLQEGKPIESYLVYRSAGVFKDKADIEANKLDYSGVTSKLIPGDMKFEDVNGDGKINGDDRERLDQNATPTFNFGATLDLKYKGFELNILFQGATGAAIRVQTESGDIGNFLKYSYDNRWSIDNPSSEHPRLASRGDTYFTGGNYGNNTYYLFSKDYIRLKNLQLAYTVPKHITDKYKIGALRLYVNGSNLLTFDKTKVFDPESTVQSGVYYPQSRVLNTGLSLSF
ncbi:TonB-dependent receptor [Arcicella sp. LKC2W]|uniref:SusC/RagA family TonB-linked outer membrane protein n=1 Tax=Arcicella sp. LKC2W TaxID=2984198 RepID=UPI002B1EDD60|nr:TonB-dependent receptor [Arcicella sp. LKC2W]MEA5457598.1 TonB-dependent receptor [Arcicella sp. LKC2W]